MDCAWFVAAAGLLLAVVVIFLALSDGDLLLMLCERLGRTPETLASKVVWITGASSGIGRALAVKLAQSGCRLVLSARREHELNELKKEILNIESVRKITEKDVLVLPLDVTDVGRHEECLRTVLDHFGSLDILINNAGRSQRAKFEDIDIQVDRDLFELNVFSQVALTTTVLKGHFLERRAGHVVLTSSTAGKLGVPLSRAYTGSKHALHGYFECFRVEYPFLNVTLLCPGPVVSEILKHAFTATPNEEYGGKQPLTVKKMTAERCAHLSAVAIANELDEVWIAFQPLLTLYYVSQYLPTVFRWVFKRIGLKYLMKKRDE